MALCIIIIFETVIVFKLLKNLFLDPAILMGSEAPLPDESDSNSNVNYPHVIEIKVYIKCIIYRFFKLYIRL